MIGYDHISKFKRINVCGCPGAGKSTLSKKLSELTSYSYYDLDDYLYDAKCKRKSKVETKNTIENLLSENSFIIDGTYFTSFEQRLSNVDLIILVESSTASSLFNFFKRILVKKQLKCGEKITLKTFQLLLTYNATTRKKIIESAHSKGVEILAYHKAKNIFTWLK